MRILISTPSMQGFGVDFISTVAHELEKRGHHIDVVQFAKTSSSDQLNVTKVPVNRTIDETLGYNLTTNGRWMFNWLLYRRWRRTIKRILKKGDYDIVVSDRICSSPGTLAANDLDTPAVILTTGPASTRYDSTITSLDKTPDFGEFSLSKKIQYPFIRNIHKWNRSAFQSAEEVVAVSEYDAKITQETFGVEPSVVYLPVPLEEYISEEHHPKKVTMLNPRTKKKGLDTVLRVAERLPQIQFQVAGTLYDESVKADIDRLTNVEFLGWCDDMRSVYQNTKILLIPSKYEEGGPRIVAEAFANGIPVIGSKLGGTPDYVGEGGEIISAVEDISAWENAVIRFCDDSEYYREKSEIAKERSKLFDLKDRTTDFEDVLNKASD